MTIQELFVQTNEQLKNTIDQITNDQWELMMPPGSSREPTNLHKAVNYHTYDDAWVPDVLAGKTKAEVAVTYEHLLTAERTDTQANYDTHNGRANNAAQSFTELDKQVHLSYGDYPAKEYLQHILSFRAVRIHDIGNLIGAEIDLPDDLAQALLDEFTPVAEGYRQMGVFPAAVDVPEDSHVQTKLFALFGRK